jgi:hypothetical protein
MNESFESGKTAYAVEMFGGFFVVIGTMVSLISLSLLTPWVPLFLDGHVVGHVVERIAHRSESDSGDVIFQELRVRFLDQSEQPYEVKNSVSREVYDSVRENDPILVSYWRLFPSINGLPEGERNLVTLLFVALFCSFGTCSIWTGRKVWRTGCWPRYLFGGRRIEGNDLDHVHTVD